MIIARTILLLVCGSAAASADPGNSVAADPGPDPHSRLSLTAGLFTPTGELGVEYAFVRQAFEVGIGAGIGGFGPQASLMPRLRFGDRWMAVTLGAGISSGHYTELKFLCLSDGDDRCGATTEATVMWANTEAGIAWTSHNGVTTRLFGGVGGIVAHRDCTGRHCEDLVGNVLPYGGIAIGITL